MDNRRTAARAAAAAALVVGAPAGAIEVWANQVGFDTNAPKRFRVVAPTDYGRVDAAFEILDAAGAVRRTGLAPYQGGEWSRHFWLGDGSGLTASGRYRIRATLGTDVATSDAFAVGDDAPMQTTARAMIEFFYVQRCGYAVPGWHSACHTDDGQTPSGARADFTGGWHDAGEYQKYPGFFHPTGTAALFEAYERRRDLFGSLDRIEPNGVPDLLEEALWGLAFESRMTEPSGRVWVQIVKVRSGSSFVVPENDTDRLRNTSDDRKVTDYLVSSGTPPPNSQAVLVAANLARAHHLLTQRGGSPSPDPRWLVQAEAIWSHYLALGSGGLPYGETPHVVTSALELLRATGKAAYRTAADAAAENLARAFLANPSLEDEDIVGGGKAVAALAIYLERQPQGPTAANARAAIVKALDHLVVDLAANPVGLMKRDYYGQRVFFIGDPVPPDGGLRLGQNGGYAHSAWAAHLGYALTGDARYRRFAADQLDWIFGANPQRWCMAHGLGAANPRGYHHRYAWIAGHLDGAVPGAVPNGYARDKNAIGVDAPWIDTRANTETIIFGWRDIKVTSHVTNEPWLPNNAGVLLALASAPYTAPSTQGPDGGADAGRSADAGREDAAGGADADPMPSDPGSEPDGSATVADAGGGVLEPLADAGAASRVGITGCGCGAAAAAAPVALAVALRRRRRRIPARAEGARPPQGSAGFRR